MTALQRRPTHDLTGARAQRDAQRERELLDGEDVLVGFSVAVAELFGER